MYGENNCVISDWKRKILKLVSIFLGAHIDSPRIDVKQNPLYEAGEFAYLDTHYYGGIKKIPVGGIAAGDTWCCGTQRWYKTGNCNR